MAQESLIPRVGVSIFVFKDKLVEQRWVDFNTLPVPLFLPWQELLISEFMGPLRRYAMSN